MDFSEALSLEGLSARHFVTATVAVAKNAATVVVNPVANVVANVAVTAVADAIGKVRFCQIKKAPRGFYIV